MLIFLDLPRNIQFVLRIIPIIESQANTLICVADGMPLPIYYEIYFKDLLIQNTTSGKYAFTPDASRDTGSYDCIPRNILGVSKTKRANVKVNGKFFLSLTL